MQKAGKQLAGACGLALLLALGGCGEGAGDTAAEQAAQTPTAAEDVHTAAPGEHAAARSAAQRSGAAQLSMGEGT